MKKIGILGGLGAESTIAYYRLIANACFERFGDYTCPDILIYSMNFQPVIDDGYKSASGVREALEGLQRAGADFAVAACNSIHLIYDEVCSGGVPLPWMSIVDVTAEEIKRRGIKTVGLLGTKFTMNEDFFHSGLERHGIKALVPDDEGKALVNSIIYDELVRNIITDESRAAYIAEIEKLRERGAEGVILGCTEIPLLVSQEHTDLPVFDTTALHAQAALDMALAD